jgi:hypothetical protein
MTGSIGWPCRVVIERLRRYVLDVGKFIGATFEGDKANMFSALSRSGLVTRDKLGVAQGGQFLKRRCGEV